MKNSTVIWLLAGTAVVSLIVGAAYGPKIPVIKQAARALPKSAVL